MQSRPADWQVPPEERSFEGRSEFPGSCRRFRSSYRLLSGVGTRDMDGENGWGTAIATARRYGHAPSMQITLAHIAQRFDGLLSGTLTRDEVDRWAWSIMEADDFGNLVFSPPQDRDSIWRGLTYLYGVDMPAPAGDGFLHSLSDIREAYSKLAI